MGKQLSKKQRRQLAENLFSKIDSEGILYYFTSYGPDLKSFDLLGFDTDAIKKAIKGAEYLEALFNELEDIALNEDETDV